MTEKSVTMARSLGSRSPHFLILQRGDDALHPVKNKALLPLGHDYDQLEYNGYGKEITTVDYDPHAGADGISTGNGTGA